MKTQWGFGDTEVFKKFLDNKQTGQLKMWVSK